MHGPPVVTTIEWPKRREPSKANLKLWRQTVRSMFCGTRGIYPSHLGSDLVQVESEPPPQSAPTFEKCIA